MTGQRGRLGNLIHEIVDAVADAQGGCRVEFGDMARVERVRGLLVEPAQFLESGIEIGIERGVVACDILVPDRVTHRMQTSRLLRHPLDGEPQVFGTRCGGMAISHCVFPSRTCGP